MIRKRGPSYQVVLRVDGERHQFTVRGLKADAERFACEKYDELQYEARRIEDGLPERIRFSALLAEYTTDYLPELNSERTRESYRDSLRAARSYFVDKRGDPELQLIRAAHIRKFLTWRRTRKVDGTNRPEPLHARTLGRDRAVLHRLFVIADRLEYRDGNPVARVDVPDYDERQPYILNADEYENLLAECEHDKMMWLWALVCGETGLRSKSEALWLRWEDVSWTDNRLSVVSGRAGHRTKSGKSRRVPMTPRLRAALADHFATYRFADYDGKKSLWVFHHTRTVRRSIAGGRIPQFRGEISKAAKRAGIPYGRDGGWVPHDLRHRRPTTWIAEGKNVHKVQKALGHSTLDMTMRYTHLDDSDLDSLVDEPAGPAGGAVNR